MYSRERPAPKRWSRRIVRILLGGSILFLIFWIVFYSELFTIQRFEVGDLKTLDKTVVQQRIEEYLQKEESWPGKKENLLKVDTKKMEQFLMEQFFVDNIEIQKQYPNILRLIISERQRSVIGVSLTQSFIVDDYGYVLETFDAEHTSSVQALLNQIRVYEDVKDTYVWLATSTHFERSDLFANQQIVRGWLNAVRGLRGAGIWFKAIRIDPDIPGLTNVMIQEDIEVILDVEEALEGQIDTLRLYLQTKPDLRKVQEYIDVRIPGRIYFK